MLKLVPACPVIWSVALPAANSFFVGTYDFVTVSAVRLGYLRWDIRRIQDDVR
jgi:hypothetical protein